MTIDLLLEVGHATVADLDCVTVEDFVEHMIFRELFVENFKECSSNVGSHVFAKRWLYQMMFLWWFLLVEFKDCVMCGVKVSR